MSDFRPVVMSIAGSDSGAGAGIQADLKTIAALGGYGVSAIAALTAQSGLGVFGVLPTSADFLELQINTLLKGFPVAAIKTGMLFSSELITVTAKLLGDSAVPLVIDPVSVAKGGQPLLEESAVSALRRDLLPLATLITPNLPETEMLSGLTMQGHEQEPFIRECARRFASAGIKAALVKGGHFPPQPGHGEEIIDWLLLPDQNPLPLPHPRVNTSHAHGTGCTLSAAIATELARGLDLVTAIRNAQGYIVRAMQEAYAPGLGIGPVNHFAGFRSI